MSTESGVSAEGQAALITATEPPQASPVPHDRIVLAAAERREAVISLIRSAQQQLVLSLFRCTDYQVLEALADARRRNVAVRVLITPKAKGWKKRLHELCLLLDSMGASVRRYQGPFSKYHAKYLVVDNGPALVTSLNFTGKCFDRTCDFLLITHDAGMVSGLQRLFDSDWNAPLSSFPEGLTERLVVGPERARAQITDLLNQTRHTIRIIDHRLLDPQMVALLKAKRDGGVSVEVLSRGELGGMLPHGKMMLLDGHTALIGSISLSGPSLDSRREVAAVVRDPACVAQLTEFFQSTSNPHPSATTPAALAPESPL